MNLARSESGRQSLFVNGTEYPVHADIDAFIEDSLEQSIGLLKTTFDASTSELQPLYAAASDRYGPRSPELDAVVMADLHCLECFKAYPQSLLFARDLKRSGGRAVLLASKSAGEAAKYLDMSNCVKCGAHEAVWCFDLTRRRST